MFRTARVLPLVIVSFVVGLAAPVVAQQGLPDRVILMKSDGSLYFLQGGLRYAVTPAPLTDAEIDAIPLAPSAADLTTAIPMAVVSSDPNRLVVEPNDAAGLALETPIPVGVICRCGVDRRGRISSFEVSIDEVVRDAWPLVQRANRFNKAPDESSGYLAVKVTMRYFTGPADDAFQVSPTDFKLVGADRALRTTAAIFEPEPRLGGSIYPGATVTGYLVYEVRKDEPAETLLFETNYNGERGVWFALGGRDG